jgi:hypothetical protein
MDRRKSKVWCASLCLVIFFFIPQVTRSFDLSVGAKAGLTFPRYIGADYNSWMANGAFKARFMLDWSAGGFVTIGVLPFLAIQPEVLVSNLGGYSSNVFFNWKEDIQGIDVQILLKWRTRTGQRPRLNLFAGPDIFFKYSPVKIRFTNILGNPEPYFGLYTAWNDEWIRVPTYGLSAGLELEIPLRRFFLTFDGRYNLSLVSHFTEESVYRKWYQQSFQLMFGTGFVLIGGQARASRAR